MRPGLAPRHPGATVAGLTGGDRAGCLGRA